MPGTRRYVIPLLIVFLLVVVVWGVIAVQGLEPRLGLDLRGGSSVTFVPTNPRGGNPTQEQLDTTVDIIRNRVNSKGVAESEVNVEGGNIVVSIPDVPNPDDVIAAVGTTAQLQFRPVKEVVGPNDPKSKQAPFKAIDCARPETYADQREHHQQGDDVATDSWHGPVAPSWCKGFETESLAVFARVRAGCDRSRSCGTCSRGPRRPAGTSSCGSGRSRNTPGCPRPRCRSAAPG